MGRGRHLSTIKSGREYKPSHSFDDSLTHSHSQSRLSESPPENTSNNHRRTNSFPPPTYDRSLSFGSPPPPPSGPLGFGIVAQARRLEYKERSQRRLLGANSRPSSLRHMFSTSEQSATETSPLMSGKIEMTTQQDGGESVIVKGETTTEALIDIVFGQLVSILLIFSPFALASHFLEWDAKYTFWFCFFTMIPLASILGDFTEEAAAHTNEVIGGLLNASFGNAVELVVAIQALLANEIRVVQASMMGSIFSNLLLVLGTCFFCGGLVFKEQTFNPTAATANMSLLALSGIALVLPTPFAEYYDVQDESVLVISRVAAIFLMFMYLQLLLFQLKTHVHLFEAEAGEEEHARIPFLVAILGLLLVTLLVAIFSEYLVGSIDGFVQGSSISRTFIGLIVIPIVGNAVEHITAVSVAMKDKMDLAMGVAVGSCTQISLFVVPLTVLVGWACKIPMTINFPHFEIILLILSMFTVQICLSNPKVNWLEGSLLITTYLMIAVGFWFEKTIEIQE
jgi:Ca2+:H+ antiporter